MVRAAGICLGQQALYRDVGVNLPLRVWTDSSAAIGTASRQGLGKLRHVECHSLWLQQRLRRKEFTLRKIGGEQNPADLFTKHLESASRLLNLLELFRCEFREGRAASAPSLKKHVEAPGPRAPEETIALATLLHLAGGEYIEKRFPQAEAPDEAYSEPDHPPGDELGDPVPRLMRTGSRSMRGRRGAPAQSRRPAAASPRDAGARQDNIGAGRRIPGRGRGSSRSDEMVALSVVMRCASGTITKDRGSERPASETLGNLCIHTEHPSATSGSVTAEAVGRCLGCECERKHNYLNVIDAHQHQHAGSNNIEPNQSRFRNDRRRRVSTPIALSRTGSGDIPSGTVGTSDMLRSVCCSTSQEEHPILSRTNGLYSRERMLVDRTHMPARTRAMFIRKCRSGCVAIRLSTTRPPL